MTGFRFARFALALATVTMLVSPASASVFNLDFTGVISNSTDHGSVLFGTGEAGGQNGWTVSGRYTFDSAAYADLSGSPFTGVYNPSNGLFPQPLNLITSYITIGGQTFHGSTYMGPSTQHSQEFVSVQDIPPVNYIQQDIYWISDASQRLDCSTSDPSSCTGGAQATSRITLKLFGITDFVGSDAMAQPLDLDAGEIASIVGGPGGGQTNSYLFYEYNVLNTAFLFNAGGEFNLTSLQMYEVSAVAPVPEPEIYAMMGMGLGLMGWAARRRKALAA